MVHAWCLQYFAFSLIFFFLNILVPILFSILMMFIELLPRTYVCMRQKLGVLSIYFDCGMKIWGFNLLVLRIDYFFSFIRSILCLLR